MNGSRMQESLEIFETLGFTLPSAAYVVGVIVFSVIGMIAYYYGRRTARKRTRWLGVALMLYPYVVWQTWLLYVVGAGLSIAVWLDRG